MALEGLSFILNLRLSHYNPNCHIQGDHLLIISEAKLGHFDMNTLQKEILSKLKYMIFHLALL